RLRPASSPRSVHRRGQQPVPRGHGCIRSRAGQRCEYLLIVPIRTCSLASPPSGQEKSSKRTLAAHGHRFPSRPSGRHDSPVGSRRVDVRGEVAGTSARLERRPGGKQQPPLTVVSPVVPQRTRAPPVGHVDAGSVSEANVNAVSTAAVAASSPLLLGPGWARSTAWEASCTANTPFVTGIPVSWLTRVKPRADSVATIA